MSDTGGGLPAALRARYRGLRLLGQGGFGVVLRARDRELERPVAIKLMKQQVDARAQERFRREAEMLARVEHPGVVRVYDYGVEEGMPYLVMELLEGRSLERGPPPEDLGAVVAGAAEALEAVHAAGLVHRDVKPANLFRCQDGRLVLTDFGIANDPDQTRMTATGRVSGTLGFLPVEAFCGEAPAAAWDWWALGASLFVMVERRVPYAPGLLQAVAAGEPLPPPDFESLEDPVLRQVVTRLMDPDPETRLASAAAVRAVLAGEDAAAPPAGIRQTSAAPDRLAPEEPASADLSRVASVELEVEAPGARRRWAGAGALLVGVVAVGAWLGSGASRGAAPSGPGPAPPGVASEKPWPHPFPEDLLAVTREELRACEGLYLGPLMQVAEAPRGEGWRPLLDPDPAHGWAVARRLLGVQAALEWLRERPPGPLPPAVRERLREVDEYLAGQLVWPPFQAARQDPPAGAPTGEAWLAHAEEALRAAGQREGARAAQYRAAAQEGGPLPEDFPAALLPSRSFLMLPFREILRRGRLSSDARRQLDAWLAPAPAEVERALWALGRAADAGATRQAVLLFDQRRRGFEPYVSSRTIGTPPEVLLGRRARGATDQLLELLVGLLGLSDRRRIGVPETGAEELESLRALQDELPLGDELRDLALLRLIEYRDYRNERDLALARHEPALREVLTRRGAGPWRRKILGTVGRLLEEGVADTHWGVPLVRAMEVAMDAKAATPDDEDRGVLRRRLDDILARRRARDPAFVAAEGESRE